MGEERGDWLWFFKSRGWDEEAGAEGLTAFELVDGAVKE